MSSGILHRVALYREGYNVGLKNAVFFGVCGGNNDECLLGYYTVWLYIERDTM
jgi:hypothetical protein